MPLQQVSAADARPLVNAMSVDVEDYYQVWALSNVIRKTDWPSWESRVGASTNLILDLFAETGATATFFTLGCVAQDNPSLVRRSVEEGHELASHGYWHDKVSALQPKSFFADVSDAKKRLEDIGGVRVLGYRAPSFSIGDNQTWAYQELAEAGYTYSSSLHPIVHDHYGRPDAPRFPYREAAGISEIPVATVNLFGRRWSCAGGGYFRLLPYSLYSKPLLRRLNDGEGKPAAFYFHPGEVDGGQPRVSGLSVRSRLRHYTNLDAMYGKLSRLLREFEWGRFDRVYPMFTSAA